MTEMCFDYRDKGYETRLEVSKVIHEDLTILNATLWEWWVAIETPGAGINGGSLAAYDEARNCVHLNPQAYVIGQYSKFITGATRIGCSVAEGEGVFGSAYEKDGQLILIVTNESSEKKMISVDGVNGIGSAWRTSEELSLQYIGDLDVSKGINLPPLSVTTIVFNGT